MSTSDTDLAVFLSNKTSPRWRAWYAMPTEERRAKDEAGLAVLKTTIFPCDCVDVMPLLSGPPDA